MSVFTSTTITLGYGSGPTTRDFSISRAEDDSFVVVCLKKQKLYLLTDRETFIGWKRKISITFKPLSSSDITFLKAFCVDASNLMTITMNGNTYNVQLENKSFSIALIQNYYLAQKISWIFTETSLNRTLTRTYSVGTTVSYDDINPAAFSSHQLGTSCQLKYNYGDGNVIRQFHVNLVNDLDYELQRKDFQYIDYDTNVVNLGKKNLINIDFGTFSRETEAQKQDDRDWIKEFILAPTKSISVPGGSFISVANGFTEVNYSLVSGIIYGKALSLSFKQTATA